MKYNPFNDPKFWTVLIDAVVSTALYFGGEYLASGLFADLKFVIGIYQPIFLLVIANMFQADAATIRQGLLPSHFVKK